MSHQESFPEVPENFAVNQWQKRHEAWASRRVIESLEESLDPDLKAIRDHDEFSQKGLSDFLDKVTAYAEKGEDWTNEAFAEIAEKINQAQQEQDIRLHEMDLFEALHAADYLLFHVIDSKELSALDNINIAKNFIDETLLIQPAHGDGINYEELVSITVFEETPRTVEEKTIILAKIIHRKQDSMSARGLYEWFDREFETLDGKTPKQVIEYGTDEDVQKLLEWARAARSQTAT